MANYAYHYLGTNMPAPAELGADLLNQSDVDALRSATPPPLNVIGISFTEVRSTRTEPALRRPRDSDPPEKHVRFLDALLVMGKRIYQVTRDVYFRDAVMYRTEGHLQAKIFEEWFIEMMSIIEHLEHVLKTEFIPYANGIIRQRPLHYFFYLGFRWHYVMPNDKHVYTKILRTVKRYIFNDFHFSETDRQKAIRFRMTAIIQARRQLNLYAGAPYLSARPSPWHGLSPPVIYKEHQDDGATFVPELNGEPKPPAGNPLSLLDLDAILRLAGVDAASSNRPPAVVGGKGDRVSACKTRGQIVVSISHTLLNRW